MRIKEDLTNRVYGKLTILERDLSKIGHFRGSYWICLCECGTKKSISRHSIINHGTTSCGCLKIEKAMAMGLDGNQSHKNYWLSKYKKRAKNLGIEFELSKEKFFNICEQECFYCGAEPSIKTCGYEKKSGKGKPYYANGIDRINPNVGYVENNCVSCCKTCNFMKTNKSVSDFLHAIKLIYEKHIKK
jgi:hypothetical protein